MPRGAAIQATADRTERGTWHKGLFAVCLVILLAALPHSALARYAAYVVDADTGVVLYERNADVQRYPASLTKMMTLYVLFEALEKKKLSMNGMLPVSRRAAGQPPSKLGLKQGESIRTEDAILALVTKSANDIATVVAEAISGSEFKFSLEMTRTARRLGMKHTSFRNASGLPNRRQLSTARDMATLAQALRRDFPQFYHYFATESFVFRGQTYDTHNHLLLSYPGAEGMKTGYIQASGFNVVIAAKQQQHRLIGVIFGGKTARSRDNQMRNLLDLSFRHVAKEPVVAERTETMPVRASVNYPAARTYPVDKQYVSVPLPAQHPNRGEILTDDAGSSSRGDWAVQVGAFRHKSSAEQRLDRLMEAFPDVLSETAQAVIAARRGKRTLYRAQFRGLQEAEAREACRQLAARRIKCVAVPPSEAALTVRTGATG